MLSITDVFDRLADARELLPALSIVGGLLVGALAIACGTTKSIMVARAREQTKRELAAYVAEGSLDPDAAVAMLEARRPPCAAKRA